MDALLLLRNSFQNSEDNVLAWLLLISSKLSFFFSNLWKVTLNVHWHSSALKTWLLLLRQLDYCRTFFNKNFMYKWRLGSRSTSLNCDLCHFQIWYLLSCLKYQITSYFQPFTTNSLLGSACSFSLFLVQSLLPGCLPTQRD